MFAPLVLLKATARKKRKKVKNVAQVVGTLQTLSNLCFLLISKEIVEILADKAVALSSGAKTGGA